MNFSVVDKQVKTIRFEEKTYLIVTTVEQATDVNNRKGPKKIIKCIKIYDDKQSYRDYILLEEFDALEKSKTTPRLRMRPSYI